MAVKLDDRNPMTSADVLILVNGLEGYWSKFSGVKEKFTRAMYSDGLSNTKRAAASGATEYENVTISKAHDPEKDDSVLEFIKLRKCGGQFDVTVRPVKRCGGVQNRGTKAWHLSGCRIMEYSVMEGMDTGSGDKVTEIVIVFSVDSAEWA